jgi:dTDP-4-dehydrorhamnose 3,5-epimerase
MKVTPTRIPDVKIIEPVVFEDARGAFFEVFNEKIFIEKTGISDRFVQDNQSASVKNVLRGLHYQIKHPQGKLVRVIRGEIFDVAVDLREKSSTFRQWVGVRLSEENKKLMWIPGGFAHGFLALSEPAVVIYKTTDYYYPEHERCLKWNDPTLNINWPLANAATPILSLKDNESARDFLNADKYS